MTQTKAGANWTKAGEGQRRGTDTAQRSSWELLDTIMNKYMQAAGDILLWTQPRTSNQCFALPGHRQLHREITKSRGYRKQV